MNIGSSQVETPINAKTVIKESRSTTYCHKFIEKVKQFDKLNILNENQKEDRYIYHLYSEFPQYY